MTELIAEHRSLPAIRVYHLTSDVYLFVHPLGERIDGLAPTGYVNWVDDNTLELKRQYVTCINLSEDPSMSLVYKPILRERIIDMMFENEDTHLAIPENKDDALFHLPWEATYCGQESTYRDVLDEITFIPELGSVVKAMPVSDITGTVDVEPAASFGYVVSLNDVCTIVQVSTLLEFGSTTPYLKEIEEVTNGK